MDIAIRPDRKVKEKTYIDLQWVTLIRHRTLSLISI
jgi:hypothetical protein